MSKFNFDGENVMVMSKPDGLWAVELWWQNGDSLTFSTHAEMRAADRIAAEVRRVMHDRVEDIARLGDFFSQTIEVFESAYEEAGEQTEFVVSIASREDSIESGPVAESELDGYVEEVEAWCNEWAMVVGEPSPAEYRFVVRSLLSIVTDDLLDSGTFTCAEADTIAGYARRFLSDAAADSFLERHALSDSEECGDAAHHLALLKD